MNPTLRRTLGNRRREPGVTLLALALTVCVACSDTTPITGPETSPTPTPATGSWTVQGTVFEHTMSGVQPLAGVRLRVLASVPATVVLDATSSADGSYRVGAPETAHFVYVELATASTHFAPCPPFMWKSAERIDTLDVHVVSGAILSTTGIPPSFTAHTTVGRHFTAVISGQVFEQTSAGREPVSGASITMDPALGSPAATLTDAGGRYLLCSIGNTEVSVIVEARKAGYVPASASRQPWFGWELDFELRRQ